MPGLVKPLRTVKKVSETVYKEKGSVFNGIIYPVSNEEETYNILQELRKKYYDAAHHCYAFRLNNNLFRYSDDGEPSGTAGIRILNAIDHNELSDVLCVVIRWFGGIKLGVGPLGKAYYLSAGNAISSAEIFVKMPFYEYTFTVPYEFTSQFYHLLEKFKARIINRNYNSVPEIKCLLPVEHEDSLILEIKHSSHDRINFLKEEALRYY